LEAAEGDLAETTKQNSFHCKRKIVKTAEKANDLKWGRREK